MSVKINMVTVNNIKELIVIPYTLYDIDEIVCTILEKSGIWLKGV